MDSGCISHFSATCWSSSYDLLVQVSGFLILFFKDHSLNSVNSNLFSAGGSFFFIDFHVYGFLYSLVQGSSIPRLTWSTKCRSVGFFCSFVSSLQHFAIFRILRSSSRRYRAPRRKVYFFCVLLYYILELVVVPQRYQVFVLFLG